LLNLRRQRRQGRGRRRRRAHREHRRWRTRLPCLPSPGSRTRPAPVRSHTAAGGHDPAGVGPQITRATCPGAI